MPESGEPHRCGPGSATVGITGGVRFGRLKSSTVAGFAAAASRGVNDFSPKRHSTNLRIDVWLNCVCAILAFDAKGETMNVGTRNPAVLCSSVAVGVKR